MTFLSAPRGTDATALCFNGLLRCVHSLFIFVSCVSYWHLNLSHVVSCLVSESELNLRPHQGYQGTTAATDGAAMYPEFAALGSALVVVMVVVELLAPTKDMSMAIAMKRKDCMALEGSIYERG